MATRLKPSRINVDNDPRVGDGASYQNDNDFHWSEGGGDMSYEDFEWVTLTGNSLVIEKISNNVTPTGNFTVTAGTLRPGIEYVLRVNTGNTPYTMTLGTGVINPNGYNTELEPNTVNQFKFIATSTTQLELEGVDSAVISEINWGEIGGTLSNQADLQDALDAKQDKLTAGEGISIGEGQINARKGPSPDGFHVPSTTEWQGLDTIMTSLSLTTGDSWRINLHMPFAGCRVTSNASLSNQSTDGRYWSSSPYGSSYPYYARFLYLSSSNVLAGYYDYRALSFSIRSFKDSYVAPNSTWTVIQGTLGSAGIFWNQSEGLISITDGTTGYTIMDKNLGATTVYNDGDTLSQANMGNMYQWGNNYGFPSTGTITNTSSTQVDASVYGPTNPYSSDTFITGSSDWSSVHNDDLWGDTTGTITQENVISNTGVLSVNGQSGDVIIPESNTKTFYLSSTSDLTNAQAAYDWWNAGKNPIIRWNGGIFIVSKFDRPNASGALLVFREGYRKITQVRSDKYTVIGDGYTIRFTGSNNIVSQISIGESTDSDYGFLSPGINYSTPYTPQYDGSPATKKYVDDNIASATAGAVSDTAYDATTWDGVTGIAPSKNAVRDKIVTMDSAISGNTSNISTINGKIPSEASTSNQLADKAYVGDSINSVTAFYITKNANGDQFATYAELAAATTFYSGGVVRIPTKNDYTIVLDDENHDHATTRYIYNNGWEYQYTVNETALTQAQLNALNSGITAGKVATYDGYATTIASKANDNEVVKLSGNQTIAGTKTFSTSPVVPSKTTAATNSGTKIATEAQVYLKANNSDVVKLTGNQTVAGTKTFSTSPVVPSKTANVANTGTAIATEAQVYKILPTVMTASEYGQVSSPVAGKIYFIKES